MGHIGIIKKRFALVAGVLLFALIVIAATFAVHCHNVNQYNSVRHSIAAEETTIRASA